MHDSFPNTNHQYITNKYLVKIEEQLPAELTEEEMILSVEEIEVEGGKKKIVKKMKKSKKPTDEATVITEETIEQIPAELTEVIPETEEISKFVDHLETNQLCAKVEAINTTNKINFSLLI